MKQQKVIISQNIRKALDEAVAACSHDRLLVLVDETTLKACWPLVCQCPSMHDAQLITIGCTDTHKTLDTLSFVWSEMQRLGATRHSLMVNLGGGMVTDLGGFAASTFKRGIAYTEAFELVLTKFKARESTVEVCGYISSPVFDYCEKPVLLLRERSETVPLEIRECSFCYDGAKLKNNTAWGFRKVFEVGKRTSFSFAVEIADRSYPVHFSFGEWVPFSEKRSRFVLNGVSCKMSDKCIILEKADKKAEKKYKKTALKKYLRTNKKVFAVRLLNLIIPKKRIWLYNDCKGVGVDNAYLQFIHDFDVDDGVERYYEIGRAHV